MTRGLNHCAALTGAAELGYQRGASEFSTLSLQLQASLAAARDAAKWVSVVEQC